MYKTCETIRREGVRAYRCGNPVHGGARECVPCEGRRLWNSFSLSGTTDSVAYALRRTLAATLPAGVDCEVRARTSSRVEPGMVRVTLETHDPVKCARRTRAVSRMRAYHWGAFGMGGALGTAVGMLLEALRQGWTP